MARLTALQSHGVGAGQTELYANHARLSNGPTSLAHYTNAQLDDYQDLARSQFPWRPPLSLTLRARFSHNTAALRGTAGFGFWNDPFGFGKLRRPTLPRAIWFFCSSPPSNMALALDVPGPGWKAATMDAWRWPFLALAPTAPIAMPFMRIPWLYRHLWPIGQRAIGVHEAQIACDLTEWHTYRIEWGMRGARFSVDGESVLICNQAPRGPLGLVIWKDNQALALTPWHLPHHQLVACDNPQWLEIADLIIGT